MCSYGSLYVFIGPNAFIWVLMGPYASICIIMGANGFLKTFMRSYGI